MKTLNIQEKKAVAVDIFTRYPQSKKVAVTSDGQAFIVDEQDINAKHHAKHNRFKKELTIETFTRDETMKDVSTSEGVLPTKSEDLLKMIAESTTVESVEAIKSAEESGKKRTSVLSAAHAKIEMLKQ